MYKLIDLFAGAGGLSHGFLNTKKYKSVLAFEKNEAAQSTYKENHKDTIVLGDVTSFEKFDEYKDKIDMIIGGPPCQGFSNANRQKFNFISDNNSLVKSYISFIKKIKPKAFLMENVATFPSETHRFFVSEEERNENIFSSLLKQESVEIYKGDLADTLMQKLSNEEDIAVDERMIRDINLILKKNSTSSRISLVNINRMKTSLLSYFEGIQSHSITSEYEALEFQTMTIIQKFLSFREILDSNELNLLEKYLAFQKACLIIKDIKKNAIHIKNIEFEESKVVVYMDSIKVEDYLIASLSNNYIISKEILDASEFGVPQKRRRYMAVGLRKDLMINEVDLKEAIPDVKLTTIHDAIFDLEKLQPNYNVSDSSISYKQKYNGELAQLRNSNKIYNHIMTQSRAQSLERFQALKPGQNFHDLSEEITQNYTNRERTQNSVYRRLDYNEISPTVTNVRKAMWIHPTQDRAISVREAARIQTFDDNFIFMGTKDQQYQQVGNAVPPLMARYIGEWMARLLDKTL